ncbi:biogenesis of lysosome-related organelles complex 1 subunit 5 isoform X1 [Camelus bactrianus]|uniref:Biogenesis of lysosome-related organelles complex 1 subunit 5 isoform X1 n=1 Tax=Camelus bactrianus TaxID=9837 RepID=A0AC58P2C0_CAMBA
MSGGGTETPVGCEAAPGGGGKKRDSLGTPGSPAHVIIKDLGEIHSRLLDHRPVIQGETRYFVKEFECKQLLTQSADSNRGNRSEKRSLRGRWSGDWRGLCLPPPHHVLTNPTWTRHLARLGSHLPWFLLNHQGLVFSLRVTCADAKRSLVPVPSVRFFQRDATSAGNTRCTRSSGHPPCPVSVLQTQTLPPSKASRLLLRLL